MPHKNPFCHKQQTKRRAYGCGNPFLCRLTSLCFERKRPAGTLFDGVPGRPLRRKRQKGRKGRKGRAGALPPAPPGEIISPGPPWFALRLCRAAVPFGGVSGNGERAGGRKAGVSDGRVTGCNVSAGVCCRTRLRWPTAVPLCGSSGVEGRIKRAGERCAESLSPFNAPRRTILFFPVLREASFAVASVNAFGRRGEAGGIHFRR